LGYGFERKSFADYKFFPEEVPVEKKTAKKNAQSDNDEEIALAIACAMAAAGKKQAA